MYCQPPALSTPAVVFTAFELFTGSFGTFPSAKMLPFNVGKVAAPFKALRAYCIAIAERIEPSCPFIVATRACSRMSSYFGIATAARMPRITITITSSINVKPLSELLRYIRKTSMNGRFVFPEAPGWVFKCPEIAIGNSGGILRRIHDRARGGLVSGGERSMGYGGG